VQLIGIIAVFPVLLLIAFIVVAPVGAYEGGELPAELLALLKREVRIRVLDPNDLSPRTLQRLGRTIESYEKSIRNSNAEGLRSFDIVVAGFTDNAVDLAFLAQRRGQLQLLALERLRQRCRETTLATDLIRRWRRWVMLEKAWLYRIAVQDVGIKAFQHFLRTVGQCMTDMAAIGLIVGVLIWEVSASLLEKKPAFLLYIANSTAVGAFIGLAYAITILTTRAWKQYMASIPTNERKGWRRSGILALAVFFGMGLVYYLSLQRKLRVQVDRLLRPLPNSQIATDIFAVLLFAGSGGYFAYRAWGALKNWRTPGVLTFPQRLRELTVAILGVASSITFLGLLGFWLVRDRVEQPSYFIWWLSLVISAAILSAGVVEAIAGMARHRERRSRMRALAALGLHPKRFWPIWLIVVAWFVGTCGASMITVVLIAILSPKLTDEGQISTAILIGMGCVPALGAIGGTVHVRFAKRRRELEDRRLIAEYSKLQSTEETEHPEEGDDGRSGGHST